MRTIVVHQPSGASSSSLLPRPRIRAAAASVAAVRLGHNGVGLPLQARRTSTLMANNEQGLSDRLLKIKELFAPSTLRDIPLTEGQRV